MKPTICAVIAVRDEAQYLKVLLPLLAAQNIDVIIIDNGSRDESLRLFEQYKNHPIISIVQLHFSGEFSLTRQLQTKSEIYNNLPHDWLIHQDADEILQHRDAKVTLRDAIQEADSAGYTVLNFEEFVFVPEPESNYENKNYLAELLRYYFFAPTTNRLNRAWKRKANLNNTSHGGHLLSGEAIKIFPLNHVLRHYIVLSQEHAYRKYLNRKFDNTDLHKGWHTNRISFTRENLTLPKSGEYLHTLENFLSGDFVRANPLKFHFWEWK